MSFSSIQAFGVCSIYMSFIHLNMHIQFHISFLPEFRQFIFFLLMILHILGHSHAEL